MNLRHLTIVNAASAVDARWLALCADAIEHQIRDQAAPLWNIPPIGVTVEPVGAKATDDTCIMLLVNTDNYPSLLGVHGFVGMPYVVVDVGQCMVRGLNALSETMSHEALEAWANPMLDQWHVLPGGGSVAREICDPVQRETYAATGTVMGESQSFQLANFVTPAWFDRTPGKATCFLPQPLASLALGPSGYAIWRDATGRVTTDLHAGLADSLARVNGRTRRYAL